MSLLKEDFNYGLFFETLDEYLTHLTNEHSKHHKEVTKKRIIVRKYLDDIDSAIDDNLNIEDLQGECELLDDRIREILAKTVRLSIFASSFPERVNVIAGIELLEEVKSFFIERELYEKCLILQEVEDSLKN
jgi:hypothetical protein